MFWLVIAAVSATALLLWNLSSRFKTDGLDALNERRRPTSRLVGRGQFVDGSRRLDVALAVTDRAFYYESSEVQASLDLEWIEEVEYDTRLATGRAIAGGKVMRLRCHRQSFEFVVPDDVVLAWKTEFPAGRHVGMQHPVAIAAETA